MINLTINGTPKTVATDDDGDATVTRLLQHERVPSPEMVAVRINGAIVRREAYDSTRLTEGDRVDFLSFMGGG